jgi:hypothetical protein
MYKMDKKFVSTDTISNYEILTDDGFKDVLALHKTINYDVYNLVLDTKELKCADFHIVFLENNEQIFVKDLKTGDRVKTIDGIENVISVDKLDYDSEMWDFELSGGSVKYYTNGILSHNTTLIRKLVSELSENKTIIYVPSFLMFDIANPELISFISKFRNSILLLEDAEMILSSSEDERNQAVSNILNISDGLLNDHMEMQIIATFNAEKKIIDQALLRKGRLMVNYKFKKLTALQATKLSKHIGLNKEYTEPKTLAEIYEEKIGKQLIDIETNTKKIGFELPKNNN